LPNATGLASSLKDRFFSQSSGVVFNIAGLRNFHATCQPIVTFRCEALFVRLSRFSFGGLNFFNFELRRVIRTVLIRSSTVLPVFSAMRFIQVRNFPELLDGDSNGF